MQADRRDAEAPVFVPEKLRWLLALFVLVAAISLAFLANRLPEPAATTSPATHFSADRAMADVRAIAIRPHPIGSPEIEATRTYLLSRMTVLGLAPQMRDQTIVVTRRNSADAAIGGRVRNIVGELKGSDPALPALLLMAHYDTAPLSPGAGDDTAGVAAALEVARALKAGGPLRRSVIFLMTDGEEAGLLGANAFFEQDELRQRAGLVINLEARGDSGKALMFQTSGGNRALIAAYRRNVDRPASDSLMVTIYKRMPNDTDLTAALERGHTGMNFAFVGHQMAYHTPLSTPEGLNPGSVQHMGDQILPIARDFAQAKSLDKDGGDMVFADLFGRFFITYPVAVGWLLAIVGAVAAFTMVAVSLTRRTIGWRDTMRGAGGVVTLLLGVATILMLALRLVTLLLRDIASPYAVVGQFGSVLSASILLGLGGGALLLACAASGRRWQAALSLAAAGVVAALLGDFSVVPLGLGLAAALFAFASFGPRTALPGWFAGAAALIGLLALLLQIFLPTGAHALLWPLILLLPALALLLFAPGRAARPAGLIALALSAALLAGLMARTGYDFFVLIGATLPAVLTPFILLLLLALAPLLWTSRHLPRVGALFTIAGLVLCTAAGIAGRTPSAASPEMVEAFLVADADDGSARWVSGKFDTSGWVKTALTQDGGTPKLQSIAPLAKEEHWVAPAKPAAFRKPALEVAATANGTAHRIDIRAGNSNGGRYMRLYLKPSVDLTGLRLAGTPVAGTLQAGSWSQLIFHASGSETVDISLQAAAPGQVEVRMAEVRDGWPATARAIPFPPHVIPFRRAGNSMIVTQRVAKW
ncbi:hypothetical protein FHR22_000549 [Sphingopyxis panaciterrae]|uniref:M20/M25/M40 family metallo-hydrolase n=1 Tax=Sphingopyxis panaciterrae TaxID=363841 RepID=UPI00141E8032|nr:M20/M25/M40 family metallo-hydrolase [Sphingopyxis panaciterrae]NIJ35900.1 hypothetical protein [Sphingopyxis panaciterrae]